MIEPPLKWSHPIFRKRGTINGHQSEPAFFRHFTLNLTLYPTHCSPKSEPWRPQQANSCVTACQTAHVCINAQACGRVAESAGMVNQRGTKGGVIPSITINTLIYNIFTLEYGAATRTSGQALFQRVCFAQPSAAFHTT